VSPLWGAVSNNVETAPAGAEGSAPDIPDLTNLRPGWWRYLDVSDTKELKERIRLFNDRSRALFSSLPPEQQENISPLLSRMEVNLSALPDARMQKAAELTPRGILADGYSIGDLSRLFKRIREKRTELSENTADLERLTSSTKDASQQLNDLMAIYMREAERSAARIQKGFEIAASRAGLMTAQENLRIRRAKLQASGTELNDIENEMEHALGHLVAREKDIGPLKQRLEGDEKALLLAKKELITAEADAIGIPINTPEANARAQLLTQKTNLAAVREATARLNLAWTKTEMALGGLLMPSSEQDIGSVKEEAKTLGALMGEIQSAVNYWESGSEREYFRAGGALSALSDDTSPEAKKMSAIHKKRLAAAQETLLALKDLKQAIEMEDFLLKTMRRQMEMKEGKISRWFFLFWDPVTAWWQTFTGKMGRSLFTIGETPVTLFGLFRFVLILSFAILLSKGVRIALKLMSHRAQSVNESAFYVLGRLFHYLVLIIGLIIGLSSLGIDFSNLAIVAGALSVGIGFGLQSIFNNFISGLILLFERPLKVGDIVELESGVMGSVKEINVRSTQITTLDNVDVLVPNSEFISGRVVNYTFADNFRRFHLPVGVAYGTDTDLVTTALLEAADSVEYTVKRPKEREPQVWLVKFGDSSLDFELIVWINVKNLPKGRYFRSEYMLAIEKAFRRHNIQIPFPQRDVHLRSMPKESPLSDRKVSSQKEPA